MKLTFICDCGNQVGFFGTGMLDEQRREIIEPEDDDRLQVMLGDTGMVLTCQFCKQAYRIDKYKPDVLF